MNLGNDQNSAVHLTRDWVSDEKQGQDLRSDSEEANAYEADDDSKIKPEIELKEETDDFVYKADFRGHLQLVSVADGVNNHCSRAEENQTGDKLTKLSSVEPVYNSARRPHLFNKKSDDGKMTTEHCNRYKAPGEQEQWSVKSILPNTEDVQEIIVTWEEPLQHSTDNIVYGHVKDLPKESAEDYYIKEEPSENIPQQCNYVQSLPEIYDYSSEIEISDSSWEQPFAEASQLHKNPMHNKNMILLTQAEKKRLYRMRIKEENPAMWSNIKKREAARKREQREKRRRILFEMQRTMECAAMPDSPDVRNHKLYLEALKERYPELWNQLINALPATQNRNEQLYNERNTKSRRHMPKPAKMYKDVIEAQKKRLYRQRIKEERPEMYARQKARDAYARSVQRLMLKKKASSEKNGFNVDSLHPDEMEKKLTYLQNLEVDHLYYMETDRMNSHFTRAVTPGHVAMSEIAPTPTTKSEPSQVCDNDCSEDGFDISKSSLNTSDSNISDADKTKELHEVSETTFPKTLSGPCSTQSDILWYWNGAQFAENIDVEPRVPYVPWRKCPQVLSEEERLQKILKERMQLKEKRRKYRLNMSPEKRNEFLEIERERLKAYRLKKKAAALLSLESTVQNEMVCVDH